MENTCTAQSSGQLAQKLSSDSGTSFGLDTRSRFDALASDTSMDGEDLREYCEGWILPLLILVFPHKCGFHPVHIGDIFNRRYKVVSKLGWGYFATVWLCLDLRLGRRVAVKVLKSGDGFTQAGEDEVTLLRCANGPTTRHPNRQRIVQLLDEFKVAGVNGVHRCLVLELLGPDLRCWQLCFGNPGLPLSCVKQVISQVLQALDYLHIQCKIIHTDIKPENILLCLKEQDPEQTAGGSACPALSVRGTESASRAEDPAAPSHPTEITVKIADLGSSCWVAFELVTGDSLFEPKAGKTFSVEEDHIAHIIELLGKIPEAVALSGKYSLEYFTRRGDMRHIGGLKPWSLYEVLVEKYHFLLKEASLFSDFLLSMLDFQPQRRSSAAQCLLHPWLSS
ncbi:SRSF protein kinase 3 isoform X4 [Esox lucius]|uniref:SRSF protein kinase 3 isoform X4 n=1 Tax=Esox lucius TaxID=8010 RepID=UPI0010BDE0AA|nr:SRSF protein kinase 3 isoform X4 [Esox lucius]